MEGPPVPPRRGSSPFPSFRSGVGGTIFLGGRRLQQFHLPCGTMGFPQFLQFPEDLIHREKRPEQGHPDERHLQHGPWKGRLGNRLLSFQKKTEELVQLIKLKFFGLPLQGVDLFSGQFQQGLRMGTHFQKDEVAERLKEFPTEVLNVVSELIDLVDDLKTSTRITLGNGFNRVREHLLIDQAEDFVDLLLPDPVSSVRDEPIQKALGISHAPFGLAGNGSKVRAD